MSHAVVGVSVAKLPESRDSSAPAVTTSRLALTVLDAVSAVLLGVEFLLEFLHLLPCLLVSLAHAVHEGFHLGAGVEDEFFQLFKFFGCVH